MGTFLLIILIGLLWFGGAKVLRGLAILATIGGICAVAFSIVTSIHLLSPPGHQSNEIPATVSGLFPAQH